MGIITDLALECKQYVEKKPLDGVIYKSGKQNEMRLDIVEILNSQGENLMKKKRGIYVSAQFPSPLNINRFAEEYIKALSSEIRRFLPKDGSVLVACLGNRDIIFDSLGPRCSKKILATRHILDEFSALPLTECTVIETGIEAKTGIQSSSAIISYIKELNPDSVILIDSLCSAGISRLFSCIQISNTGLNPGSAFSKESRNIDFENLGIPVISVGIPTISFLSSYINYLNIKKPLKSADKCIPECIISLLDAEKRMDECSDFLSLLINCSVQKNLTFSEILKITDFNQKI